MNANTNIFGRFDEDGTIMLLHVEDGHAVTRLDADCYPVGSNLSTRWEHPEGIIITPEDAARLGIAIESD